MYSRQYKTDSWEKRNKQTLYFPLLLPLRQFSEVPRKENSIKGQWCCWVEETETRVEGHLSGWNLCIKPLGRKEPQNDLEKYAPVFSWIWGWTLNYAWIWWNLGFSGSSDSKESTCNVGDLDSIPGLARSPGGGNEEYCNPLQYSCLENPMDRGAWQATVHGVAESDTTEAT